MNIPGFTAETSLSKTRGHYRGMASHSAAAANSRAVLPQMPRQLKLLGCLQDCANFDSSPFCQQLCFWNDSINASDDFFGGGGGAGGGGGKPDLTCARCKNKCLTKPVAQRAACRANCDDVAC